MSDLIFGANLGSEIVYNGVSYYLDSTGEYNKEDFDSISLSGLNFINIQQPKYKFDNTGNQIDFNYPVGAEAESYKYGWKAQGIIDNNPMFPDAMWVSPQPIKCYPKKAHKEFTKNNDVYTRYSVTEWELNYFTAPCDGIFRVFGGANFSLSQNATLRSNEIYSARSIPIRSVIKDDKRLFRAGEFNPYTITGDTVSIAAYGWINDTTPIDVNANCCFNMNFNRDNRDELYAKNIWMFSDNYVNRYSGLFPVQMKEGDTFCYYTTFLLMNIDKGQENGNPDDIDFSEWEDTETESYRPWYWFNGIFYPNTVI